MKIREFTGDTSIFHTVEEEKIGEYFYSLVFDFDGRVVPDEFMIGANQDGEPTYANIDTLVVDKVYIYKVSRCHETENTIESVFEIPDNQYRNLKRWLKAYIETHSDNYINDYYEIH